MSKSLNVKVFCRIRPENEREKKLQSQICVEETSPSSLKINDPSVNHENSEFSFDTVFGMNTKQVDIFTTSAVPIVNAAMTGINGTLFCYGQTSSGKTFTMEGIHDNNDLKGVLPRTMEYIFELIPKASSDIEFSIKCNYFQIYNEKIQDLLDIRKTDLSIREDKTRGIWLEDITDVYVTSKNEMMAVFQKGSNNRTVSATEMNKGSSRSHSIFTINLTQRNTVTNSLTTSKLHFVDLAGSEKMSKTGIEGGMGLKEAQNINKSLMTLGMVINALSEGASHIPYRDSKLTRVLSESLGGNSMTTLIVTISPASNNVSETISTLRFGQRAKKIKNKVSANREKSSKELTILLAKANEKIKQLESIINSGELRTSEGDCQKCNNFFNKLAFLNIEMLSLQGEYDDLADEKKELETELKSKTDEIYSLNDKINKSENDKKMLIKCSESQTILIEKINKAIRGIKLNSLGANTSSLEEYMSLFAKNLNQMKNIFRNKRNSIDIAAEPLKSSRSTNATTPTHVVNNINFNVKINIKRRNTFGCKERSGKRGSTQNTPRVVAASSGNTSASKANEIQKLNEKISELEETMNMLNEKLISKENELETFKEGSMNDLMYKEKKILELINKINDIEDENYKLKHISRKDFDKNKFIMMDKQIKTLTMEMQRLSKENERLRSVITLKDKIINNINKEDGPTSEENEVNYGDANAFTFNNMNDEPNLDINQENKNNISMMSDECPSNRIVKVVRGGDTSKKGGFFSSMLNNDEHYVVKKYNRRATSDNFEKEMMMLDNDNMSEL